MRRRRLWCWRKAVGIWWWNKIRRVEDVSIPEMMVVLVAEERQRRRRRKIHNRRGFVGFCKCL